VGDERLFNDVTESVKTPVNNDSTTTPTTPTTTTTTTTTTTSNECMETHNVVTILQNLFFGL
jgi:hypothetical protein